MHRPPSLEQCQKNWRPLTLICGDAQDFLTAHTQRQLRQYAKSQGYACHREQGPCDFTQLSQPDLFQTRHWHLFVTKNWQWSKQTLEQACHFAQTSTQHTTVCILGPKLTAAQKKKMNTLLTHAYVYTPSPLNPTQFEQWLRQELKHMKLTCSDEAWSHLCQKSHYDPSTAWTLLQHLRILSQQTPITPMMIDSIPCLGSQHSLFTWHDWVLYGKLQQAIQALPSLQRDVPPLVLLALFQKSWYQLTTLYYAKTQGHFEQTLKTVAPWRMQQNKLQAALRFYRPRHIQLARHTSFRLEQAAKGQYDEDFWVLLTRLLMQLKQEIA